MSEVGTPPAPSHRAKASTALSNTGWASSPATRTACHGDAAGSASSACQQPSQRTAIAVQKRARRGGIERVITGGSLRPAHYGTVAAVASNARKIERASALADV